MVIISEKTHAEHYRNCLTGVSSDVTSPRITHEPANMQPPEVDRAADESFWLKLNGKIAAWVRKHAD